MANENENNATEDEMYSVEEMVYGAHDKIDALIDLLIEKKIISEEDYTKKIQDVLAEYDDESEDDSDDDSEEAK